MTGLEERTVEEKRPRDGRLARYFDAPPPAAGGFESEGGAEEPAMAPENKNIKKNPHEFFSSTTEEKCESK